MENKQPFDLVNCMKCGRELPYSQTVTEGEYKGWCNVCQATEAEDKHQQSDEEYTSPESLI